MEKKKIKKDVEIEIFNIVLKKYNKHFNSLPEVKLFNTIHTKLQNESIIKKELEFYQHKLASISELQHKENISLPLYSILLNVIIKLIVCLYMCGDKQEYIWNIYFEWLSLNILSIQKFYSIVSKNKEIYDIYYNYFDKIPMIGDIFKQLKKIYDSLFVYKNYISKNNFSEHFIIISSNLFVSIKSFLFPIYAHWNVVKKLNIEKQTIVGLHLTIIYMIFEKNIFIDSELNTQSVPLLEYNLFQLLEKIRIYDSQNGDFCNLSLGFDEDNIHILK